MLKNRIIPCLDVKNGRVVKGINFVELKDAGDPVEQAKIYSEGGADEICFLDITASNENRDTIIDIVRKTAKVCFVPLTVGGGVRTIQNITERKENLSKRPRAGVVCYGFTVTFSKEPKVRWKLTLLERIVDTDFLDASFINDNYDKFRNISLGLDYIL